MTTRITKQKKKADILDFGSRQPNKEERIFQASTLREHKLIVPPYDPTKLSRIVESSSVLGSCIEAYIDNVDGFGYEFQYTGNKKDENSTAITSEKQELLDFFKQVNETQSFISLRKELRRDYETTGNAYIEIIRYRDDNIATLYRADTRYVRLQVKQKEEVPITVPLTRNGKTKETTVYKRFRKFAMIINRATSQIKWFKEYGDPRRMCAITGEYEVEYDERGEKKVNEIKEEASEILHLKQGNDTYGIPRWAGIGSVIKGLNDADYVNYDLFQNSAIPPMAVLVSGGRLTQEATEDIAELLEGTKGPENYHKVAILEAVGESGEQVGDKPSAAKVDFKKLWQHSDSLFKDYIEQSERRVRAKFRLPAFYLGKTDEVSRAAADSAKMLAEEQVFRPERSTFDEIINFTFMKELGATNWIFRTNGPKLIEGVTLIDAVGKFARAGALSTDYAIKVMNKVLDLDATEYEATWSQIPIAVLLELIKKKQVSEIEGVGIDLPTKEEAKEVTTNLEYALDSEEMSGVSDGMDELKEQLEELRVIMEDRY